MQTEPLSAGKSDHEANVFYPLMLQYYRKAAGPPHGPGGIAAAADLRKT